MAKKATLKTVKTKASVPAFLNAVADPQRRADAKAVATLMAAVTKAKPAMWGTSIVGFGTARYKYASGREGDWFTVGFSPRKDNLTLYLIGGFRKHADLMEKLGTVKMGGGCLYVRRLEDIDQKVLRQLIVRSVKSAKSGDWSY